MPLLMCASLVALILSSRSFDLPPVVELLNFSTKTLLSSWKIKKSHMPSVQFCRGRCLPLHSHLFSTATHWLVHLGFSLDVPFDHVMGNQWIDDALLQRKIILFLSDLNLKLLALLYLWLIYLRHFYPCS